jgi:hypothetical protein
MFTDFRTFGEFAPGEHQHQALDSLLSEVLAWSRALAPLRAVANPA